MKPYFNRRMWIIAAVMVAFLAGLFPLAQQPTHAQSDEVLARIDQAMGHLSGHLGGLTINRRSHNWRWEEQIYADASLGCGVPGYDYEPASTRGYVITITVDDVAYDYRSSPAGDVLILCINGQPDASSIGLPGLDAVVAPPPGSGPTDLLPTDWWVLAHVNDSDTLHFININGEQAFMTRPLLPNEQPGQQAFMQASRNGRYLIVASRLNNDREGLGIFDIQTGQWVKTHVAQEGEGIILGGRYSSNDLSTRMAVGFTSPDFGSNNPAWRVIIFDLATGNAVDELRSDGPEIGSFVGGEVFTSSMYAPYVAYYDLDEGLGQEVLHIQYFLFGEPPPDVPTLAWYPDGVPGLAQELVTSPMNRLGMDFNPLSNEGVFPYADANLPSLAGVGLYTEFNAIARGTPMGGGNDPGPTPIHYPTDQYVGVVRWAADGGQIVFSAGDAQLNEQWYAMRMGAGPVVIGPDVWDVLGIPPGFVWVSGQGVITASAVDGSFPNTVVFSSPTGQAALLWASPPGAAFGLTTVTPPGGGGPGTIAPPAEDTCSGVVAPRLTIGQQARVAFTDGAPLNVRNAPNGTQIGQMAEGTQFTVLSGPTCQDGFNWWQINSTTGLAGWVAEGDNDTYFVEPFSP